MRLRLTFFPPSLTFKSHRHASPLRAFRRPLSTTQTGTSYELLVLRSLIPLAFSLERVGGRSDHGIDLQGYWNPPVPTDTLEKRTEPPPRLHIPTIVQCKAHVSRPSPSWIRELSGAIPFAPLHLRGESEDAVVGVLACKGALTLGIREAVLKSERGIVWCQIGVDGKVRGMMWNQAVREIVGSLGVGYVHKNGKDGTMEKEMRLMMHGRVLDIDGPKD